MDRLVKLLAALAGLVVTAGLIGAAVSGSVASARVAPVENRVTAVETQQKNDAASIADVKRKVDAIYDLMLKERRSNARDQ